MELNKEYEKIILANDTPYNALEGKVVDKVAFYNKGDYGQHICLITFTDKTYIALGADYEDLDAGKDEPKLRNHFICPPQCWNSGNFRHHMYVDNDGKIIYDRYIQILRDLGFWKFTDEEEMNIIKEDKKRKEDAEYQQYLRLKEKFENNGN